MKTGEFIISLAKQGGVELDEAQTKALSESATDLQDDIATSIQGSLFTKESALANPDIINNLKAQSLDAVDSKMEELAKSFGLDEGFIHNLKETKGTYNRIDLIGKTILTNQNTALEKAKEGAPKGDQKELQAEISKLNKQIEDHTENTISKQDHEDMIEGFEDIQDENAIAMLQLKANSLFSGQNWAMDVDPEVNLTTAKTLFNAELATQNITLVDDNGILKLQTQEKSPYYVDNKEVTPQSFVNTLLAGKKLLKVTDTKTTGTGAQIITGGENIDPSVVGALATLQKSMDETATMRETQIV